jgi:hypothetical protein
MCAEIKGDNMRCRHLKVAPDLRQGQSRNRVFQFARARLASKQHCHVATPQPHTNFEAQVCSSSSGRDLPFAHCGAAELA